jgi:hypothetical protein
MGKMILILLAGLSTSFVMMSASKNRRIIDSATQATQHFEKNAQKDALGTGAYMALNRLYRNRAWRDGYSNKQFNEDTINVAIQDQSTDSTLLPNVLRIEVNSSNPSGSDDLDMLLFDSNFDGYAVWAKDSVASVATADPFTEYAPYMPIIDDAGLANEAANQTDATAQPHVYGSAGTIFQTTSDPFPPGSSDFLYSGSTPNVIHILGHLKVPAGDTIYGIYIVEGNVILDDNAIVEGILYQPNAGSSVKSDDDLTTQSNVNGGVVTRGAVDGRGYPINVTLNSTRMDAFVSNFAPDNPPMRILGWK